MKHKVIAYSLLIVGLIAMVALVFFAYTSFFQKKVTHADLVSSSPDVFLSGQTDSFSDESEVFLVDSLAPIISESQRERIKNFFSIVSENASSEFSLSVENGEFAVYTSMSPVRFNMLLSEIDFDVEKFNDHSGRFIFSDTDSLFYGYRDGIGFVTHSRDLLEQKLGIESFDQSFSHSDMYEDGAAQRDRGELLLLFRKDVFSSFIEFSGFFSSDVTDLLLSDVDEYGVYYLAVKENSIVIRNDLFSKSPFEARSEAKLPINFVDFDSNLVVVNRKDVSEEVDGFFSRFSGSDLIKSEFESRFDFFPLDSGLQFFDDFAYFESPEDQFGLAYISQDIDRDVALIQSFIENKYAIAHVEEKEIELSDGSTAIEYIVVDSDLNFKEDDGVFRLYSEEGFIEDSFVYVVDDGVISLFASNEIAKKVLMQGEDFDLLKSGYALFYRNLGNDSYFSHVSVIENESDGVFIELFKK